MRTYYVPGIYNYCAKRNHCPHFTGKSKKTPKELSNLPNKAKPTRLSYLAQLLGTYSGVPLTVMLPFLPHLEE